MGRVPGWGKRHSTSWRHLFDLSGPSPQRPAWSLPALEEASAELTPDGSRWITAGVNGCRVVALDGPGTPRVLIENAKVPALQRPDSRWFSPGGSWVAFASEGGLSLAPLNGKTFEPKPLRGLDPGDPSMATPKVRFADRDRLLFVGRGQLYTDNTVSFLFRTELPADRSWPVVVPAAPYEVSPDGLWMAAPWIGDLALYPLSVDMLVQRAKSLAGRELGAAEHERFQIAP